MSRPCLTFAVTSTTPNKKFIHYRPHFKVCVDTHGNTTISLQDEDGDGMKALLTSQETVELFRYLKERLDKC